MSTASLTLGVSVGAAFALMIVVMVAVCCIFMHKHSKKHSGYTGKVGPDNPGKIYVKADPSEEKKREGRFWSCCVKSTSGTVPPPDPPIKLELKDLRSSDVTLAWKPPTADAASRVQSFVIYVRPSDKPSAWSRVAKIKSDITQHLVQPLQSNKRYILGVSSRNSGGESAIIETKPFILTKEIVLPGKPNSVIVTDIQSDRVTLQWEAPNSDGNARIEFYHISINNGDSTWNHLIKEPASDTGNAFVVQHLAANTPCKFRICAENSLGKGPFAETKRAVILKKGIGPPSKPEGPIRYNKVTHNSVTLSWKPPCNNGDLPISGYIIDFFDPRSGEWKNAGLSPENVTTFRVSKLPANTEVRLRVTATNEIGNSTPLIGTKVKTNQRDTSTYGSKSRNTGSEYSNSTSSNTKLTKSALQRVLAHWEPSHQQMAPTSTNSAFTKRNKSPETELTDLEDEKQTTVRSEPRTETTNLGQQ